MGVEDGGRGQEIGNGASTSDYGRNLDRAIQDIIKLN